MSVKAQITFKPQYLAGIRESAAKLGKDLPEDFTGPTFDNCDIGPTFHHDFIGVRPVGEAGAGDVTYMYPTEMIGRIKVERIEERTTESGIVVVNKPGIEVLK